MSLNVKSWLQISRFRPKQDEALAHLYQTMSEMWCSWGTVILQVDGVETARTKEAKITTNLKVTTCELNLNVLHIELATALWFVYLNCFILFIKTTMHKKNEV